MNRETEGISFDNTENAFAYKSNKELKKANFLFSSMGYSSLVQLGTHLIPWLIRSGLPVKGLIRRTIFSQFVGGETLAETAEIARKLGEYRVQVILDYGVEGGDEGDEGFDGACDEFIRVIEYAATQPNIPFMSIKVTGFARFGLLERLHAAVRRHGDNTLFYIRYEDPDHPNGTVEVRAPGLLVGYIDHFSHTPDTDKLIAPAHDQLLALCRRAHALWSADRPRASGT